MGIIITEPESLNNGVVLSEYYIGLRKNSVGKVLETRSLFLFKNPPPIFISTVPE